MNFYKRHLGDYAKDAGHLSMLEHGAYTLLLDRIYTTEHSIEQTDVYRICRARSRDEKAAVDAVLREFFTSEDGAWMNRRATEELAKATHQRDVNRNLGKRGGRPKQTDSGTEHETESVIQMKTESVSERQPNRNPSQTPDSRLQDSTQVSKKPSRRGSRLPAGWSPDAEAWSFAVRLLNGRAESELEKFRDYWVAQPGQRGVKSDWSATWRNWARRAAETAPKTQHPDPFEVAR